MNQAINYSDMSADEWLTVLTEDRKSFDPKMILPQLPEEAIQRRFVGKAYKEAFEQGIHAYSRFVDAANELGGGVNADTKILDFGCGWGRMSQIAFWKTKPENIYSMDVQEEALEICRSTGLATNLVKINMTPPIQHPDASFDFIMAYSVFSHLSEELYLQWIAEFSRLLRPGGVLAITTRGRSIIRHAKDIATSGEMPPHAKGLAEAFHDWERAFAEFDRGQFVYRSYPRDTVIGSGYGEACIPESYFKKHWPEYFSDFLYFPENVHTGQAIAVGRKRS